MAINEETVTISKKEYQSLKVCAELIQHPDVLKKTLEAAQSKGPTSSLEEAFKK
jgi:hypothetical protein